MPKKPALSASELEAARQRVHIAKVRASLATETHPIAPCRLSLPEPSLAKPDVPKSSRPNMASYATSAKVTTALRSASLSESARRTLRMPTLANDAFYRRHANISPEEKDMTIHNRPSVPLSPDTVPLVGDVYAPALGHFGLSQKKK